MQTTKCVVALIIVLSICAPCWAQESTAYMLRYFSPLDEAELVKVGVPPEYDLDPVEPIVVGPLGMGKVTSMAMSPSGMLLALDYEGDRLLEINIETGAASPYVDLDLDISQEYSGITFDEDGLLWLLNHDSGCFIYHINTQTGETSLITQLEDEVAQIAVHNGAVYVGWIGQLSEVDTTTGELALVVSLWDCSFSALNSNGVDLWGIWGCWGPSGLSTHMGTLFPLSGVMEIAMDDPLDLPFALVVVTQPPPTAIPAITSPGLIVFGFLLAGAGFLIVHSRNSA